MPATVAGKTSSLKRRTRNTLSLQICRKVGMFKGLQLLDARCQSLNSGWIALGSVIGFAVQN